MWRIVQNSHVRFDNLLDSVSNMPYTFSYLIRKRMQIDSWMELPKDKRPPVEIWDKADELEEWFDRINNNIQTKFDIGWNEDEVEK
jgi:hypothetical protein